MVSRMDAAGIIEALKRLGVPHDRVGAAIGRERSVGTKLLNGTRSMKAGEMPALQALVAEFEKDAGENFAPDPTIDYVPVEILPTFAGMGGGGTGDAARETALLPRRLVQDELRAKAHDLLVINVRGNSMEPLFRHGDQLIIDCRDTNPLQPGPFALLYDDGYVVKNVAWVEKRTKLRVSSSNTEFGSEDYDPDEIRIMGRPVWFARRL